MVGGMNTRGDLILLSTPKGAWEIAGELVMLPCEASRHPSGQAIGSLVTSDLGGSRLGTDGWIKIVSQSIQDNTRRAPQGSDLT